jgi:hypothetical protein
MPFENGPNFAKLYEIFPAIFLCKSIQNSGYLEKFCDFLYQFFNDSSQTSYSTHSRETSRRWWGGVSQYTPQPHRAQATPMVLRNDAEFYIPVSRLTQCSLLPYYSLPRIWLTFDQLNPGISILRDKKEFNKELKTYFINKLSSTIKCNRLLCASCSSFIAFN